MYTSRGSNSGDVLVKWTFNFKIKYTLTNKMYPMFNIQNWIWRPKKVN